MGSIRLGPHDGKSGVWVGSTGQISLDSQDYGPTSRTDYWAQIQPPRHGYTIYVKKASGGPSIHVAHDEDELLWYLSIFTPNQSNSVSTGLGNAHSFEILVVSRENEGVETTDLVFNIDAGMAMSYPAFDDPYLIRNIKSPDIIDPFSEIVSNGDSRHPSGDGSIQLNGAGEWINLPADGTFKSPAGLFEFWVRPELTGEPQTLWVCRPSLSIELIPNAIDNTVYNIKITDLSSQNFYIVAQTLIPRKWTQLCFIFVGDYLSDIFINGSLLNSPVFYVSWESSTVDSHTIGSSTGNSFTGNFSILRYYSGPAVNLTTTVTTNYLALAKRFGHVLGVGSLRFVHQPYNDWTGVGDYSLSYSNPSKTSSRAADRPMKSYVRPSDPALSPQRDDRWFGPLLTIGANADSITGAGLQSQDFNCYTISQWVKVDDFPKKFVDNPGFSKTVRAKSMCFTKFWYDTIDSFPGLSAGIIEFGAMAPYYIKNDGDFNKYAFSPFSFGVRLSYGDSEHRGAGKSDSIYTDYKFNLGEWYLLTMEISEIERGIDVTSFLLKLYVNDQLEATAVTDAAPWARSNYSYKSTGLYAKHHNKRRGGRVAAEPGFLPATVGGGKPLDKIKNSTTHGFNRRRFIDLTGLTRIEYSPISSINRIKYHGQDVAFGKTFIYLSPFSESVYQQLQ